MIRIKMYLPTIKNRQCLLKHGQRLKKWWLKRYVLKVNEKYRSNSTEAKYT